MKSPLLWNGKGHPAAGEGCIWKYSKKASGKECVVEWTDGEWFTVRNYDSFKEVQLIREVIFECLPTERRN